MKLMKVATTVLLLMLALPALAQYTTVTGTVTDTQGNPYVNGKFEIDYVNGAGCTGLSPAFAAAPNIVLPQVWASGYLTSTGALPSTSVPDNTLLVCNTSQWKFTIWNNALTVSFTSTITISGGSQNVGATLTAASVLLVGAQNTRVLAALPPQTAITTVSTIQVMNGTTAITIPAGTLNQVGKTARICGMFVFSNGATTPAITISLKYGSVVLAAPVSAVNANSNSSSPAYFCFTTTTTSTGATGTLEAHGWLQENTASAVAGAAMALYPDTVTAASSAVDLTSAITVTINMTVATGPVTTATLRQATVELLN